MRRKILLMTFLVAIIGFCGTNLSAQNVAKVGNTEYRTIDEAIANWTNNTTLTLLSDVTLSDVISLSSTEYHILDLGSYTMTAASKKDAIQIVNNGRSNASYALDIKADATNPGGITASGKTIVVTTGKSGVKDRPIIRFYNGVFNGSYVVKHSGSNGTNCPQFQFHGGVFNGTISTNRALNQFYGGIFNGSMFMSVDSSAYTLVAGGTFNNLSNSMGSALNSDKFTIGTAKGVYNRDVYIDDNGNTVIAAEKPEQGEDGIEADVPKKPGTNDYLAYSKVADEGRLSYTDVYVALNNNTSAAVTVYVDELNLEGINFNGTIVVPEDHYITITNAPTTLVVKDAEGNVLQPNANGSYSTIAPVGGTWGGIDWSFEVTDVNTGLGTLTIAPTTGTPVPDPNASSRTYEVGQWREAVIYDKSSGEGKAIDGWPYDRSKVQTLIIKEGVTSIGSFAAQGFTNLTGEVVIPYTVKYIGQEAFQNSRMTTLTFGAVPEEKKDEGEELCIAQGAFKNLIIEEVSLPADRPVHLHAWVFNNCHNLKNAVMPATIVSVHGTNHIDYFKDFNAHSNPAWTKSSEIFAYNENMETVTFGSQEVMDLFYANNNGTANDYLKANVGLVTYCDVQDAIAAAVASGESISLVKNCNADDDNKLEIPSGVTITVDLKGKTMTGSILAPNANLTVKNGTIDNKDASVSAIEINAGELTLNNVNISSARHAVRIDGDVTATIDGGEYKSATGTGTGTYHAVNVSGAANVTINAGTFVGPKGTIADSGSAINVQTGATVTIKGGDFSKGKNSTLSADGTLIVEGGTYDQDVTKFCSAIYRCVYNSEIEKYEIIRVLPGQGTEEDPYLISSLEDLVFFRNSVNAGETKFNAPGVWVALGDDIDMKGTVWTDGIGDGINVTFDGCFDGRTHTIKNFTMEAYADSDGYVCGGLFGYIYGKNGVVIIRNLVMENVNVTCDAERTGDKNKEPHNIGALVGFAMICENSIIDNITVKGNIVIDAQNVDGVGAIVGYSHTAAPNITNCKVVANDGSYIKGHSFVGGITGYSYTNATITDCTVENIDIIGTSYSVGGIAGIVLANNTIKNCTVTENVEVNGQANVGYLVGAISSNGIVVNIENCSAREPMIGGNYSDNIVIVARIENKYYSTLAAAFTAAQNDETVTLVANTELSEMIAIPNGKIVTLDLNGKTITGTDNTSKNFSIIDNRGNLTITDSSKPSTGKMTLTATVNSGWNRYSAVIANNPGGKLTIEAGTIEHLGGTDMAYGIDNFTNGKGTYAETVINGGTIKSTYRAIRQFLNGTESQNILTVNGGIIEGANKSIWMQDPNKSANTGTLTVSENAELIGDVYLFVTEGSTEWPVEVSIVAAALQGESTVLTGNVPAGYDVQLENGVYGVKRGVAKIDNVLYSSLADAVAAAQNNGTIQLLWQEGQPPIAMNANLFGKNVTITGTATVDWSKGNLFVGRGGEGNATLTFDGANLTSASNSVSYGIHVSGREKNANDKYDGTLIIKNSKIELDYLINKGAITLDNSTLTVKNGFSIGGRPASETESGVDATATITLSNGSKVVVNNHNGMGLGYEAIGVMNIDATSTFETTQAFLITAKGTLNNAGTVNITGALTNNGTINFTAETATLATTTNNLTVVLAFENSSAYKVVYENNTYSVVLIPVQEQHLVAGWNWYSTYLDITLNDLTTALGDNGVYIKNNDGIYKENNGGSWMGELNTINPSEMYLVQTTAECDLKLAADLLNPNEHQISLIAEWNWIGYPSSQEGVNINDALKNLNANPGDIIKSLNNGYAEYAFGQWLGTLNTMVPGVGYKYNNKSGEAKTFYYNFEATRGAVEANVTAENNYWTPNATKYPYNMTMTAVVDGLTNGNYEVAAFVNGEVRGSARPIYVEAIDAHIFFLTIHGEDVEEMSFRLYDIDTDTEYDLNDRINYSNDAMLGSVNEPYVFTRGTTGIGEAAMSQVNIYPNPTTIGTEINLEATCDKVEVFNALGVKVAEYQNVDSIDALETAGIYVIRITNNGNTQNCRLVVK